MCSKELHETIQKKKENQNLISQVSYFTLDPKSLNFQKSLLRYHSVYITLINIARTNLLSETRKEHFFPSFPIMAQLFINRTHLKRKRHRILSAHDSFERTFDQVIAPFSLSLSLSSSATREQLKVLSTRCRR